MACRESLNLLMNDGLDVIATCKRLADVRRVDVKLNLWSTPRQNITLKVWRNVEDKGVGARVESPVYLRSADQPRW